MRSATPEQRQTFATEMQEAMRKRAETLPPGTRLDDWLGGQVGLSGQAIRNYLAAIREPKSGKIVERIEAALEVPSHHLGRHLGYGPSPTQRLDDLETRMNALDAVLQQVVEQLEELAPLSSRARPSKTPTGPGARKSRP